MKVGWWIGALIFGFTFVFIGEALDAPKDASWAIWAVGALIGGIIGSFVGHHLEPVMFRITHQDWPECKDCKHYLGEWKCKAFSDSIPPEIMLMQVKHDKPYEGDHGIQYAPAEWSKPMSKSKIMAVANLDNHERFQEFTRLYNATIVEQDGLILFKIQLDNMDKDTLSNFETTDIRDISPPSTTLTEEERASEIANVLKKSRHLKTSRLAISSLVLGIIGVISCLSLLSIVGLILAILALKKIKKYPSKLQGRGIAMAGLILSCIGIIIYIDALAFFIIFYYC